MDLCPKGANSVIQYQPLAESLIDKMLQALDYLNFKGVVHRDIKPSNSLYTALPKRRTLTLLSELRSFMTPEAQIPGTWQTQKMDVWSRSLFVTLIYE
ncbi:uncharacterized protein Z519_05913 [Cladophialophora bantiana CBS 173.52]|uniref:Protein kinase domain-containing protein n=1 Tax=Cladophialophora bantiana (strain ATCC 10958 / CBS 173.52 / CDC B-1940 / NIH 8579) TaxID=1442370 RepID=A0A0D2HJ28_CLAB1|nr:uncharacterized protein Z519_05913 [Cladophialophora bantiana CBS 173.52]KIW93308.1 hypothetical protein Z519_05913 [Cladophialophora bantiana CBS 173.52]